MKMEEEKILKIKRKMEKKGQHEIVGFVLIVLIVSIIGIIFLAITLANPKVERETSVEISNLLEGSMYHTTDCAVNFIPQYRNLQDLVKECYKDQTGNFRECLDGGGVCESLEANFQGILDSSLRVSEDSPNKAYTLDVFFASESEVDESILKIERGVFANCTSILAGRHSIPVSSFGFGKIDTNLVVCKG